MAITVRDIIDRNFFKGLTLAAGGGGIDSPVTWMNIMEILDAPDAVKRGELLLTTGFELNIEEKYCNLIQRLKSRGVAALVIQTGYYISSIPEYILSSAEQYDFPVLLMPSCYSFSDILHIFMDAIYNYVENESRYGFSYDMIQSQFLPKILNSPLVYDISSDTISLFLISAVGISGTPSMHIAQGFDHILAFLSSYSNHYVIERFDGCMVVAMSYRDVTKKSSIIYDLQIQLTFMSERDSTSFYIARDSIAHLDELTGAYNHCIECLSLLHKINAKCGICPFEDYSFIRMFGYYYNADRAYFFDNTPLHTLLTKDRNDHTNLVQTLRIYIAENCNITHAAERLFIHRHTMMNRIQAITDITGVDLNDYYQRIYLSITLLMHDYFAI